MKPHPIVEWLLRIIATVLGRLLYRVRSRGAEQLPEGGFLLLPNHLTWIDAIILSLACPRKIRFIIWEEIYHVPWLNPALRAMDVIPISPTRAKDAIRTAAEHIASGEIVCLFPEGELSRNGLLLRLKRGYELIARAAKCPVVPVWMDQLWGSIFSYAGGKYFFKWPRRFPYVVTVAFGAPIPTKEADIATVRQRFLALGEYCYQQRDHLRGHLGRQAIAGLKNGGGEIMATDGMDGGSITRANLLAAACSFSRILRARCPERRIAIILPPGRAAFIANLAVVLAGKVPANLNFTAGRASLEAACRIGELRSVISARAFAEKIGDIPWPPQQLWMEELAADIKSSAAKWRILGLLPTGWLAALLDLPREGDREEAVLLFTSGSSGEPKGVVLTHRNVLGNVGQFAEMLDLAPGAGILACLPFFHSFGSTVTLWFPVLHRIRAVTFPSPLEVARLAELVHEHQLSLLCSTPTFLRGWLRKARPEQLASLQLIVTGAEKLPNELAKTFEEKMGKPIYQGYGLTETSPVTSVNLPEPPPSRPTDDIQPSNRLGTVGKLAPGMAAEIRDPDTGAPLSLHDTGMLWLRGPNIFPGYLGDPARSAEVIVDGWFKTGDLARFDEDGFLIIEGRLSRFSKIGGEMVPHETVETRIGEVLALPKDERVIALTAIPDDAKGEALVLLSTRDIDARELREKLNAAGLPNLFVPKIIKRVDAIPMLATGKLDLRACKEAALK